jgi:hypothetical protein
VGNFYYELIKPLEGLSIQRQFLETKEKVYTTSGGEQAL